MLRMMEPQLEEDFKPGQKKRQGSRELLEEQKMRHKLKQVRSLLVFMSSVKKIDNLAGKEGCQERDPSGQCLPREPESQAGQSEGR